MRRVGALRHYPKVIGFLRIGTVGRRDAAVERTGKYSQRVPLGRLPLAINRHTLHPPGLF